MIQLPDQPTIDINKIVQKYQSIVGELQLQNILLNIRVEELQQQLSAHLAAQALEEQAKSKKENLNRDWKAKDWDPVGSKHS